MSCALTADYATLPLPLTLTERQALDRLETVIRDGLPTFYAVGEALTTIRNQHLYRTEFRTFEEYCLQKWDIGRASAYRMIDAAEVKDNVSPHGDVPLPTNESQVRALKAAPPDKQADVWNQARATAPDGKVTAKHITQIVQTVMPPAPEPPPAEPTRQISVFIPDNPAPATGFDRLPCEVCDVAMPPDRLIVYDGQHVCADCYAKLTQPTIKDCRACAYHKMMGSPKPGVRIPNGQGKCIRPEGHCDPDIVTGYLNEDGPRVRHPEIVQPASPAPKPDPQPAASGILTSCNFCGAVMAKEQAFMSYDKKQCVRGVICRTCAAQAVHDLLDPTAADVVADVRVTEQAMQADGFGWQQDDRAKIIKAGLRILRVGGRFGMHELMELRPMKSGQHSYSWQIFERFPSQAALKRRITELAKDPNIILENRL
jgi:hypothetical protein